MIPFYKLPINFRIFLRNSLFDPRLILDDMHDLLLHNSFIIVIRKIRQLVRQDS